MTPGTSWHSDVDGVDAIVDSDELIVVLAVTGFVGVGIGVEAGDVELMFSMI